MDQTYDSTFNEYIANWQKRTIKLTLRNWWWCQWWLLTSWHTVGQRHEGPSRTSCTKSRQGLSKYVAPDTKILDKCTSEQEHISKYTYVYIYNVCRMFKCPKKRTRNDSFETNWVLWSHSLTELFALVDLEKCLICRLPRLSARLPRDELSKTW